MQLDHRSLVKIYENLCKSLKIHENLCKSMKIYGNLWKSMKIYGNLWKSMKIQKSDFSKPFLVGGVVLAGGCSWLPVLAGWEAWRFLISCEAAWAVPNYGPLWLLAMHFGYSGSLTKLYPSDCFLRRDGVEWWTSWPGSHFPEHVLMARYMFCLH